MTDKSASPYENELQALKIRAGAIIRAAERADFNKRSADATLQLGNRFGYFSDGLFYTRGFSFTAYAEEIQSDILQVESHILTTGVRYQLERIQLKIESLRRAMGVHYEDSEEYQKDKQSNFKGMMSPPKIIERHKRMLETLKAKHQQANKLKKAINVRENRLNNPESENIKQEILELQAQLGIVNRESDELKERISAFEQQSEYIKAVARHTLANASNRLNAQQRKP